MNHSWHHDTCTRCGVTRQKKRAKKVLYLYPVLTPAGVMVDKPATAVVQMYHYSNGGFNRPDCPDELLNERRAA